jgi:hypothetical protein
VLILEVTVAVLISTIVIFVIDADISSDGIHHSIGIEAYTNEK